MKKFILLIVFGISLNVYGQEDMLCMGHHWTEDEANGMMKKFEASWNDLPSWEKRAEMIREGIIDGMGLNKMPAIEGAFNPIVKNTREMDGYIVENIALESFPGFILPATCTGRVQKRKNTPLSYVLTDTCRISGCGRICRDAAPHWPVWAQ